MELQEKQNEEKQNELKEKTEFSIQNDLGINKMADGQYSSVVNVAFDSMKNFVKNKENFHRNGNRKENKKI